MSSTERVSPLANVTELVVTQDPDAVFYCRYPVADSTGTAMGSIREVGKVLPLIRSFSNGLFFADRPFEIRDTDDDVVLRIERRGGSLRRRVVTARNTDGQIAGRIVANGWASSLRERGSRVIVDNEPVAELSVTRQADRVNGTRRYRKSVRIVAPHGAPIADVECEWAYGGTFAKLRVHQPISHELRCLVVVATFETFW